MFTGAESWCSSFALRSVPTGTSCKDLHVYCRGTFQRPVTWCSSMQVCWSNILSSGLVFWSFCLLFFRPAFLSESGNEIIEPVLHTAVYVSAFWTLAGLPMSRSLEWRSHHSIDSGVGGVSQSDSPLLTEVGVVELCHLSLGMVVTVHSGLCIGTVSLAVWSWTSIADHGVYVHSCMLSGNIVKFTTHLHETPVCGTFLGARSAGASWSGLD